MELSEISMDIISAIAKDWQCKEQDVADDLILAGLRFSTFIREYRQSKEQACKNLEITMGLSQVN